MNKFMREAFKRADYTSNQNIGGPFGACIVKDGKVVAVASNTVLFDKDPTCHAEMNAIRLACSVLDTYDLSGCELYTTGYPCPMCLSAIMWANIKKVYYGTNLNDAEDIGFRDDFIYNFIKGNNSDALELEELDREKCLDLFKNYTNNKKVIY